MAVTSIDLNPPTFQILTTEILPITVEWQDLVGIGNSVGTPSAKLYDNSNGSSVATAFNNDFGANGTQAQYILDGSKLLAGHEYTAIFTVVVASQIFKGRLTVSVPR